METASVRRLVRSAAVLAAAASAVLYFLIGFGVLDVGRSTSGQGTDILAFGLMTGGAFTVTAVALLLFESRLLWIAVAILQVVVLVGYVLASAIREPPFEIWGLLVKACQAIVLVAVAYLAIRSADRSSAHSWR